MPLIELARHSRRTRTAVIGAVFSAVLVAAMAIAAIACAEDSCRELTGPSNARVVFEVDRGLPDPVPSMPSPPAPIAPAPPQPASR
jgi:hypothetical protein